MNLMIISNQVMGGLWALQEEWPRQVPPEPKSIEAEGGACKPNSSRKVREDQEG